MHFSSTLLAGFLDETVKIAAAHGRAHITKQRAGRRSISVDKLLDKDRKGTLWKKADSQGNPQDVRGDSVDDPGSAPLPKRRGEVPTRDPGNIPVGQKTGMVQGANAQTPALTSGEDMRAGNSKPRLFGELPTQNNMAVDEPNNRIEPRIGRLRPAITNDESAKRPKKGDTPTQNRDMNIIDRFDGRGEATTVTGLGQSSTNIGAFNSPSEHA